MKPNTVEENDLKVIHHINIEEVVTTVVDVVFPFDVTCEADISTLSITNQTMNERNQNTILI